MFNRTRRVKENLFRRRTPDVNHRRFPYLLSRRFRKKWPRVYAYTFSGRWPAFFSRNPFSRGIPAGSVLARELREYNNSRGWSYLLPRNSAAKNRPHRGVNINASLGGWRDAAWNGFVGGRVENCGGWQGWKRVERQVVYASGAWTLSFGIVTYAQVK